MLFGMTARKRNGRGWRVAVSVSTLAVAVGTAFAAPKRGGIETVARFYGPDPVGVAVSAKGRIFISFPRTIDPSAFDVAELKNGKAVPYPSAALTRNDIARQADVLLSVQGITVDARDRLWLLDSGKIKNYPVSYGGPKLVAVDLRTNKIVQKILFPAGVAGAGAYLNDVRVDLRIGQAGTAYITDSSTDGPNAIIVVDLATGMARRRLNNHPSTKAEKTFVAVVEGQKVLVRPAVGPPKHDKTGADGIALDGRGQYLYYCPNAARHTYRVSLRALANPRTGDTAVAGTVRSLGRKRGASDGLLGDAAGNLYLTDYEHNAIVVRHPNGTTTTLAQDPRMIWPDSMAIHGGYLYFTANQLNRRAMFHHDKDQRRRPYFLFRVPVNAQPALLR